MGADPVTMALIAGVGASVASGGLGFLGSMQQQEQLKQAADAEKLQARQRSVAIKENLQKTLATQRAMFGARGVDPFQLGTPSVLARESEQGAGLDLAANNANLQNTLSTLSFQRQQAGLEGLASLFGGFGSAAMTGSRIGTPPGGGGGTQAAKTGTSGPRPLFTWQGG